MLMPVTLEEGGMPSRYPPEFRRKVLDLIAARDCTKPGGTQAADVSNALVRYRQGDLRRISRKWRGASCGSSGQTLRQQLAIRVGGHQVVHVELTQQSPLVPEPFPWRQLADQAVGDTE